MPPTSLPSAAPTPALRRAKRTFGWSALVVGLILIPLAALVPNRWISGAAKLGLGALALFALGWLFRQLWRRLLWRVGRRLAFSYFLVGVLPLGLIAILIALTSYLVGGFLLGHLFRDQLDALHADLVTAAARHLDSPASDPAPIAAGQLRFADYRDGRLVTGPSHAPPAWPSWIDAPPATAAKSAPDGSLPYVALPGGTLGAAAGVRSGARATLVWFEGDLAAHLRERTSAWVTLLRSDAEGGLPVTRIQLLGDEFTIRGLKFERSPEELAEYFRLNPPETAEPALAEKPFLVWMERIDRLPTLAGETVTDVAVAAGLAISPRVLFTRILSSSQRVDSAAWIALAGTGVLLLEFWFWAAMMALFMIVGLSRAVNRLSKATAAIAAGDFSFRIQAKRKDQLGDLQRSFNTMTERLEELVHTAAQRRRSTRSSRSRGACSATCCPI